MKLQYTYLNLTHYLCLIAIMPIKNEKRRVISIPRNSTYLITGYRNYLFMYHVEI
jgi:hypothetical protein